MARSQIYKTRKGICKRCGEESQQVEKVSSRLLPPDGGLLCPACFVPAALEAQMSEKKKCERCKEEVVDNKCACYPFFPLYKGDGRDGSPSPD